MKALFTKITLTVLVMLMATACSKDDNSQESISREQLQGRWAITALDGKLFVKVGNIPETEAPLMPFWSGKIFYFQTNNNLSVLDKQTELFDFGTYTLSGNRLSVANYPGVLQINVSQNETMTLTNKQDDYYKMVAFYSGQSEAEIRQMYRVEGDIVFHLKKN